ncbi:MAG TPA: hypothetical protein VFP87_07790, partial [Chitinophagaceae bacterium]|nr:hypothetical protein [Chitinophagaceae bacterium]
MKTIRLTSLLILFSILGSTLSAQQPPKATAQPVTETFFGKVIVDRYRNLENLNDSTVMNWYKEQASFTEEQFSKLPIRNAILNELRELDSKFRYTIKLVPGAFPTYRGQQVFYVKNNPRDQSEKLVSRQTKTGKEVLIFDPNETNQSGHLNVISGFSVNDNGSTVSVVIIQQGKEVGRLLIIDTKSGKIVDSIMRVVAPANWVSKNSFMYVQYHSDDVLSKRFRLNREGKEHTIGTNSVNDPIILSYENNPDIVADSTIYPDVSLPHENAKYLIALLRSVEQFNDVYVSK